MKITTQPIKRSSDLAAAAAEVLGGPPVRPPVIAPPLPDAANADKREAYRQSHLEPEAPAAPLALGNLLFDAPAHLTDRAAKVSKVRDRLAALVRFVLSEEDELMPIVVELEKDTNAIKAADQFDPRAARLFLAELKSDVTKHLPKPEPKKGEPVKAPEPAPETTAEQ